MRCLPLLALAIAAPLLLGQLPGDVELEAGCLLVADREMRDPNFFQTVILVTKYEDEGTLGIIVNRRTDVPISRMMGEWREARGRSEPVFLGGPVEKGAVLGLLRSGSKPLMISDRPRMQKLLADKVPADKFRLYLGYTGWASEQLENEIEAGAWHVFPGNTNLAFDPDPDSLWSRLIHGTETRIASAR